MSGSDISERVQPPTGEFRKAMGWSFVMNGVQILSTIGTSLLLAALLGPRAFGIVGLALIYITLLQLLMQQGFVVALIQRPDLNRRHLESAFWLTMGLSTFFVVVSVMLAGWWAGVNNAPDAKAVIWALSALIILKGLVIVQEGLLRRQLRFRELALRTTAASVLGAGVGVTWAIINPTLWALVAQQLTTNLVGVVVLWGVSDWRPRFRFWPQEAKELSAFAGKSSLSGLGSFVNNRVDALLVGLYFGASAIGLYRLASRLVESAIEATVVPIQNVALPELARQNGPAARLDRYRSLLLISAAVAGPMMATVFACAGPLMRTMGGEWVDATTALQLLSIVGLVRGITMLNSPAIQAAGRPGANAIMTWLAAGLSALSFILVGAALSDQTIDVQVAGMAASRAMLYALVLMPIVQGFFVSRIVGFRMADFARTVTPTLAVSTLVAIVGTASSEALLDAGLPNVVSLALIGSGSLAISGSLVILINPAARTAAERVRTRLRPVIVR